jgi:hypothetical protein
MKDLGETNTQTNGHPGTFNASNGLPTVNCFAKSLVTSLTQKDDGPVL